MKAITVTDKEGRRQVRHNGIMQDGDHCHVPISLMDSRAIDSAALQIAIDASNAVKRQEAFDAKTRAIPVTISRTGSDRAMAALEIASMTDAERDAHNREALRDHRKRAMDQRWRGKDAAPPVMPSIESNQAQQQLIDARISSSSKFPMHRPGYRFGDEHRDPAWDAAKTRADARDAKLEDAWKHATPVLEHKPIIDFAPGAMQADAHAELHPADAKDRRLERAWKHA